MDANQIEALKKLGGSLEKIGAKLAWLDGDHLNPIVEFGPAYCPPGEVPEPHDVAFFNDGTYISLDNTELNSICFYSRLSEELIASVILEETVGNANTPPLHTESK